MTNIAFLFTGIGDLSGGGGAERFFSNFFERYNKPGSAYKLFFITDEASLENLNAIGILKDTERVLTYRIFNNRFKNILEAAQLVKLIAFNQIKLIQIPLYHIQYYPLVRSMDRLPVFLRPKLVYTVTDSFIPHYYFEDNGRGYNFKTILTGLFENIKLDAVISWYELFKTFAKEHRLIKSDPEIYCISSRYSDKVFNTTVAKKKHIVFASRLTIAKRPMMFVEALRLLKEKTQNAGDWHFFIYGKGNLEQEIRAKLKEYDLESMVTLTHNPNLTKVFEESACFVSTQDFENFPSLSMNEAMAAGNAIIARNVGQTHLFVQDGVNGLLMKKDNEQGLADALYDFITHPEWLKTMGAESIRLTKEVHTYENFKKQAEDFWQKTLHKN
jgi:glycosyltransferase involved in cell wall biosynthesis